MRMHVCTALLFVCQKAFFLLLLLNSLSASAQYKYKGFYPESELINDLKEARTTEDQLRATGGGIGSGLSLRYDTIKAHGGELKVASEESKGTPLTIQLPAQ